MKIFSRRTPPALATPDTYVLAPAARQIVRNLMILADGTVLAGYRVGADRWDFTGESSKASTLSAHAEVWAELARDGGRWVHERVTTRPHPVNAWAKALDARTPDPVPDVHTCAPGAFTEPQRVVGACGCETWNTHLARMQRRIATAGQDTKVVFRYVQVGSVRPGTDVRAALLRGAPDKAISEVLSEQMRVRAIVSGWGARPMTEAEQAWLRMRSLAPGVPVLGSPGEGGHDEQSIKSLADNIRWEETPFGRTVTVRTWEDGTLVERAVMVMSVSRLNDLAYPGNGLEPWQTFSERAVDADGLPISVEWSINGKLHTGLDLTAGAERGLRLALNLQNDYHDHHEPPPEYTERGITAAKRIRDEVTTGQPVQSTRFIGTINLIISGAAVTEPDGAIARTAAEVVEARAAIVRRLYAAAPLRMEMAAAQPQSVILTSTIPGQARDTNGYQRQVTMPYLAAGMPSASTEVGDRRGPYMGYTRGAARRAFMHDPHYATEGQGDLGRGQNMWLVAATLGGGKSVFLGSVAYNAARRGSRVVISDPSGPLGRLCQMPELKGVSNEINLLDGEDGILNPAALIREPSQDEFAEWNDYERAVQRAVAERRALIVDAARRCLTADLYGNEGVFEVLTRAAEDFVWTQHSTMWNLVANLERIEEDIAARVARALRGAASQPLLSLLFAPDGGYTAPMHSDAVLTVVSTPGIRRAPDSAARWDWTPNEVGADVVLRLAALYTDRLIYGKRREERAVAILDEGENLTDFGSGRAFLARLGRDHSKWNTAVYLGVKSISDTMLEGEVRNFLAGAFVGRMANEGEAAKMLDVLHITERRHAGTLMRLSRHAPGEFVHLDADGKVAAVRIDVDYHPVLKDVLLTDPTPSGAEHWNADLEETL